MQLALLTNFDWILGRVQSIRLFWADTDVFIFHCQKPMLIFCNTQTTVERQYFNVMKKHITWNSAPTRVINSLASGWGFLKKKRLNTRGFAWEFLWSGMLYRPGESHIRRGKSSSLHSKKFFCLRVAGFL